MIAALNGVVLGTGLSLLARQLDLLPLPAAVVACALLGAGVFALHLVIQDRTFKTVAG
jgi:hypothetical protein